MEYLQASPAGALIQAAWRLADLDACHTKAEARVAELEQQLEEAYREIRELASAVFAESDSPAEWGALYDRIGELTGNEDTLSDLPLPATKAQAGGQRVTWFR